MFVGDIFVVSVFPHISLDETLSICVEAFANISLDDIFVGFVVVAFVIDIFTGVALGGDVSVSVFPHTSLDELSACVELVGASPGSGSIRRRFDGPTD